MQILQILFETLPRGRWPERDKDRKTTKEKETKLRAFLKAISILLLSYYPDTVHPCSSLLSVLIS